MVSCALEQNRPLYTDVDTQALADNRIVPLAASSSVKSTRLVSNGTTFLDAELAIVDPQTKQVLPEGQVGEIWSKGDHIAKAA